MSPDIQTSISSLLDQTNVVLVKEQNVQKGELIKQLVSIACKGLNEMDTAEILDRVLKREEGIPTTLDTGLSIPHSRVDEITTFRAALAVVPAGIKDPAAGNAVIKVMFLFLSPSNPEFFQKHLQILAELSERFKDSFVSALTNAGSIEEVLKIINE
ncbi:PTS system nitrogen regulatory IIA component [Elusimicrobium simillimum]|uniref:PTS sugar transporter subunit IIA n=1 Tax=Elusimicrobium simillimum TaxID=3143438 RepID=UPI003C702FDE